MGHVWPQTAMHACMVKMRKASVWQKNKRESVAYEIMGKVSVSPYLMQVENLKGPAPDLNTYEPSKMA